MITLNKFDYQKPWGTIDFKVIVQEANKHKKPAANAPPANYKVYTQDDKMEE